MKKIEHIGIAVKNLEEANKLYTQIFGVAPYKQEIIESEGVITSFFRVGPNKIELLQATNSLSPISKFIEKKGEGMHHVAFAVEDIYNEINRMRNEGFKGLSEQVKEGADNKLVYFFHPKNTGRVLIELCAEKKM